MNVRGNALEQVARAPVVGEAARAAVDGQRLKVCSGRVEPLNDALPGKSGVVELRIDGIEEAGGVR